MRVYGIMLSVIALSGCSTELSTNAQLVRQISTVTNSNCKFLGPVVGKEFFGLTGAHDVESALNKVRNEVAARGGNAFVLTQSKSTIDGTISQADAYLCPL